MYVVRFLRPMVLDILWQVSDEVRAFCEDGRIFIRDVFKKVLDAPFPAYTGPKLSKTALRKLQKEAMRNPGGKPSPPKESLPPRKRISHIVMNLPDTAILFLDAFRGVLATQELQEIYPTMPMIHCHCFTRELEQEQAEVDIKKVIIYLCLFVPHLIGFSVWKRNWVGRFKTT